MQSGPQVRCTRPTSPPPAGGLIFFCLLFFHQGKKRRIQGKNRRSQGKKRRIQGKKRKSQEREFDVSNSFADIGMGRPCMMPASMLCATHNARFVCKPLGRVSSPRRGRCFPRCGEMDFLRRTHVQEKKTDEHREIPSLTKNGRIHDNVPGHFHSHLRRLT